MHEYFIVEFIQYTTSKIYSAEDLDRLIFPVDINLSVEISIMTI